ncbi:MAG: hypothetical protein EPN40_12175 [Rhodanobacteraceae bacterium]|nr:MAG: hypothetical protein EPN40_12175 [Rhodanobacteraceae bacterium]
MSRGGWRPHIERALRLDVRRLFASGTLHAGCRVAGTLTWPGRGNAKQTPAVDFRADLDEQSGTLVLRYAVGDGDALHAVVCTLRLSSIALHYGGRRWYAHCPLTGRRATTLHKWPGIDLFCHRDAVRPRPTYASQRDSGSYRTTRQRVAIRHRLGADGCATDELAKPKRMRWQTFERYATRDAELAERMDACLLGALARMLRL